MHIHEIEMSSCFITNSMIQNFLAKTTWRSVTSLKYRNSKPQPYVRGTEPWEMVRDQNCRWHQFIYAIPGQEERSGEETHYGWFQLTKIVSLIQHREDQAGWWFIQFQVRFSFVADIWYQRNGVIRTLLRTQLWVSFERRWIWIKTWLQVEAFKGPVSHTSPRTLEGPRQTFYCQEEVVSEIPDLSGTTSIIFIEKT